MRETLMRADKRFEPMDVNDSMNIFNITLRDSENRECRERCHGAHGEIFGDIFGEIFGEIFSLFPVSRID
jgi:hypothetical protein